MRNLPHPLRAIPNKTTDRALPGYTHQEPGTERRNMPEISGVLLSSLARGLYLENESCVVPNNVLVPSFRDGNRVRQSCSQTVSSTAGRIRQNWGTIPTSCESCRWVQRQTRDGEKVDYEEVPIARFLVLVLLPLCLLYENVQLAVYQ